jgi:hypothetical protein
MASGARRATATSIKDACRRTVPKAAQRRLSNEGIINPGQTLLQRYGFCWRQHRRGRDLKPLAVRHAEEPAFGQVTERTRFINQMRSRPEGGDKSLFQTSIVMLVPGFNQMRSRPEGGDKSLFQTSIVMLVSGFQSNEVKTRTRG